MISKNLNNNAKVVFSFDDFHPWNIRLAQILAERELPATFFIETESQEGLAQIAALHAMGFEIGSHTVSHPADLKALPIEEIRAQMMISKDQIERLTKKPCTSFAYPRGRFNDDVVRMAQASGFTEARTTHVLKIAVEDPLRMPTTIHVFDGRQEYKGRTWRQMADFYIDHAMKKGGIFHLWGHAHEIGRDGQWDALTAFFDKIKEQYLA